MSFLKLILIYMALAILFMVLEVFVYPIFLAIVIVGFMLWTVVRGDRR